MVNSNTKFSIYMPEQDREYICTVRHVRGEEYYAEDVETELYVTEFDTADIVRLMFTSELERVSNVTNRQTMYVKTI